MGLKDTWDRLFRRGDYKVSHLRPRLNDGTPQRDYGEEPRDAEVRCGENQ